MPREIGNRFVIKTKKPCKILNNNTLHGQRRKRLPLTLKNTSKQGFPQYYIIAGTPIGQLAKLLYFYSTNIGFLYQFTLIKTYRLVHFMFNAHLACCAIS